MSCRDRPRRAAPLMLMRRAAGVSGRPAPIVARGEVVIVGGNYGIRIVDVVSNPFRERRGVRGGGIGQPTDGAK